MKYALLSTLFFAVFSFGKFKSVSEIDYSVPRKILAKSSASSNKEIALTSVSLKISHKSINNIGFLLKANVASKNINTKMFQTAVPYYNRFSVQQNAKANSRFQKINLNTSEIIAKNKKYQNKIYITLFK